MTFIDNLVDNTTGTIKLKAVFPNTDHALWPGQFVNVVMTLRTLHGVTVIPSEAVQSGQNGQFVFVLNPDQTVVNRPVKLGQSVENLIVVDSGVAPGETVITDGQMRLVPGARVRVVNPVSTQPPTPLKREPPDEYLPVLHRTPHLHHAHRLRHSALRHRGLSLPARCGPAQRRLPDHPGQRQPSRRQPGHHGLLRRHAAGKAVLDHRGHRFDELLELARQHLDHHSVHARPQHRRRRPGHRIRHCQSRRSPAAQHAASSVVPKGESGGPAHFLPRRHLRHAAHLHRRRIRRDRDGAAYLHRQRRVPGQRLRRTEIRRPHSARSRRPRQPRHRRG